MEFSNTDALNFVRDESKKHIKSLIHVSIVAFAAIIPPAINSFMIQHFINDLSHGAFSINFALLVLTLVFVSAIFNTYQSYLWQLKMNEGAKNLASEVYEHVQSLPMSYFRANSTGAIMAKVLEDTDITGQVLAMYYPMLFVNISQIAISAVVLLLLNWELAVISFLSFPLSYLFVRNLNMKQREAWEKERIANSKKVESVREKIDGISIIKIYNRGEFFKRIFSLELNKWFEFLKNAVFYGQISKGVLQNFASILSVIVLIIGAFLATRNLTSIGSVIAFFWYIGNLYAPIEGLADWNNARQQIIPMGKRILSILSLKPERERDGLDISDHPTIEFSEVCAGYNEEEILHTISLRFEGSKMNAIVGESGSGKSTLALLLIGFNHPISGKILIDGKDMESYSTRSLKDSISFTDSQAFLFNLSIRDNITLGKEFDEDEIVQSAQIAGIHDFIMTLPKQYDTIIEENGQNLSEGQRQRIALARAIIRHPKILILDEATSGVDSKTEAGIYEKLREMHMTLIVIAHRLSTIYMADNIYVIENGKIVCHGTHSALLEKCAVYKKTFEKQLIHE